MLKLHSVKRNGNNYCGPSAISALTGLDTKQAAQLIRDTSRGSGAIKGTYTHEVRDALQSVGIVMSTVYERSPDVIGQRVEDYIHSPYIHLMSVDSSRSDGGHWVLAGQGKFVCGLVVKVLRTTNDNVPLKAVVRRAYRLQGSPNVKSWVKKTKTETKTKARIYNAASSQKAKAVRYAEKIGCRVEVEKQIDTIWVYGPDWMDENEELDPYAGEHCCCGDDWPEVMERLAEYEKAIAKRDGAEETVVEG